MANRIHYDPFHLGPLRFNVGRDEDGVKWDCDQLIGWDGTPTPQIETAGFGYSDGVAMSERSTLPARFVEIGGAVYAPNRVAAERAWRQIQSVLAPDNYVDAELYGPIAEKLTVRLAGELSRPKDAGVAFRFAGTLIAPWPYKEGVTPKTGIAGVFTGTDYYRTYPRTYPLVYTPSTGEIETTRILVDTNAIRDPAVGWIGSVPLELCTWEDGPGPCYWNAEIQGNGEGLSYVVTPDEEYVYVDEDPAYWRAVPGVGGSATTTRITDFVLPGGARGSAVQVVWDTPTSTVSGGVQVDSGSGAIPAEAVSRFAAVYVYPNITQRIGLTIQHRDDALNPVGNATTGPGVVCPSGQWTRLTLPFDSPDGATRAVIVAQATTGVSGQIWSAGGTLIATRAQITDGDTEYFDGNTSNGGLTIHEWAERPHLSASRKVEIRTMEVVDPVDREIVLVNEGNADAYLVTEITGPLPANDWYLTVDTTGEQQTFTISIGAGQTLRVDNRRQVATLDGAVVDFFIRGDWLRIPPGVDSSIRLMTTENYPEARLRVTAADTWR